MSTYPQPHPVWAGVAVRLSDGTVRAFEMADGHVEAEVRVEEEAEDVTSYGPRPYLRGLRRRIEVTVSSDRATIWTDWKPSGTVPPEVEPPRREIET